MKNDEPDEYVIIYVRIEACMYEYLAVGTLGNNSSPTVVLTQ